MHLRLGFDETEEPLGVGDFGIDSVTVNFDGVGRHTETVSNRCLRETCVSKHLYFGLAW
jgi:hypothetical protein